MSAQALPLVLLWYLLPVFGDKHSLCYLYTIQSKSSTDRVSEFSAVTLLDDRQIDSYSSTDGIRTHKQAWMKEMKESEWKAGTDKLKYDGQQLNKILHIQMEAFKHDESDSIHILQWRHSCEIEKHLNGSVTVLNVTNEYCGDGQNLICFNFTTKLWSSLAEETKTMEKKLNAEYYQNTFEKCEECVHWLKIYLRYNTTKTKASQVDVHVFVKKSVTDSTKLTLTCLATGFYPKHVMVSLRKVTTSLPEHLLTSSGVRPNEDGTFQLRKSVEIQEDEAADYDCYVTHSSLSTPVIKQWDGKCNDCTNESSLSFHFGALLPVGVVVVVLVIYFLYRRGKICRGGNSGSNATSNGQVAASTDNIKSKKVEKRAKAEKRKKIEKGRRRDDRVTEI